MTDKSIPPLTHHKLTAKANRLAREDTAGKAWGNMAKVELTDKVRADLKAV